MGIKISKHELVLYVVFPLTRWDPSKYLEIPNPKTKGSLGHLLKISTENLL